ncbi:hypothetical protein OE165_27570, partial [Escherichia coli]|nr:hypothetical protein [Escherichia coli]
VNLLLLSIYLSQQSTCCPQVLFFLIHTTFFEISSFNLKLPIDGQAIPLYYRSCASKRIFIMAV